MNRSDPSPVAHYLVQAAGIPPPWRASDCRVDEVAKMVHLWITRHPLPQAEKKRGWFGRATEPNITVTPADSAEMHWRHINCMDYICRIHTVDQLEDRHHELPWLGQPGLPFSNRLARQVFACLMEGMEMSAICDMLMIPFSDLWKCKHALDHGLVKFEYTPAKKTRTSPPLPSSTTSTTGATAGNVPDVSDPVWERLITGELDLQIKTLSFQLILSKLRQQVSLQQNDEVKLMKLRELHRYVERNERSLTHELQQLKHHTQSESV